MYNYKKIKETKYKYTMGILTKIRDTNQKIIINKHSLKNKLL